MNTKSPVEEIHKTVDFTAKSFETSLTLDFPDVEELRLIAQKQSINTRDTDISKYTFFGEGPLGQEWEMIINFKFSYWLNTLYTSSTLSSTKLEMTLRRRSDNKPPVRIHKSSCNVIADCTVSTVSIENSIVFAGTNILSHSQPVESDLKHLTVKLKLAYVRLDQVEYVSHSHRQEPIQPRENSTLTSDIEKLFSSGKGADMSFVFGDQKLLVHKAILMARFPYFANMMESGMKESNLNEIEIKEDDVASFSEIIRYVYCDQLPKDLKNNAIKLLPLADKYQLLELKQACEAELGRNVTANNVCQILILADLHKCYDLKNTCLSFASKCRSTIDDEAFQKLQEYPYLLVELVKKGLWMNFT